MNHARPVPVSPSVRDRQWSELQPSIDGLDLVRDGWNGHAAPAPAASAIEQAREFLAVMKECDLVPTRVSPSAIGGVGVTFRRAERKSYVEFFNSGGASALFADDATQTMSTRAVGRSKGDYLAIAAEIEGYLDG